MGTDKAFVMLAGETLLARALRLCRAVSSQVLIVGDRRKFASFAAVVEDVFTGCGPLGGIHAALRASQTDLNLVLAVDVPFVSPALLKLLVARARDSSAVVTVPRGCTGGNPYVNTTGELSPTLLSTHWARLVQDRHPLQRGFYNGD